MQIICPNCDKRLQISDDKLPDERQVHVTCPKCRQPFTFDPRRPISGDLPQQASPDRDMKPILPRATAVSSVMQLPTRNIDLADVGPTPRALVCLDATEHRKECETILPVLGFNTVHIVPHQVDALTYLTQVTYECVIVDARFDGSTQEANPIMACVSEIPMAQRRQMFVALCTPGTEPGDALTAYGESVNLVISHADMLTCHRLLEQHMAEYTRLYRIYQEIGQELGKV